VATSTTKSSIEDDFVFAHFLLESFFVDASDTLADSAAEVTAGAAFEDPTMMSVPKQSRSTG